MRKKPPSTLRHLRVRTYRFFSSCLYSKPQACDVSESSETDQICWYSFPFSYTVCVSVAEKECFCKLPRRRILKPSLCLWLCRWLLVWHLAICLILCTSNSPPVTDGHLTSQRRGNEVCKVKWDWKKRQKESKNLIAVCHITVWDYSYTRMSWRVKVSQLEVWMQCAHVKVK